MTFRRTLICTAVAFTAALALGAPSMADAQAPPGAGPGPGAQGAAGDPIVAERAHCEVYELDDITNQLRH